MLTLNSTSTVTLVGAMVSENEQKHTTSYRLCFTGYYAPRFGTVVGQVAGYCDCDKALYDAVIEKKFPYTCTGSIFQNSKTYQFELADLHLGGGSK